LARLKAGLELRATKDAIEGLGDGVRPFVGFIRGLARYQMALQMGAILQIRPELDMAGCTGAIH